MMVQKLIYGVALGAMMIVANSNPAIAVPCPVTLPAGSCVDTFDMCDTPIGASVTCTNIPETVIFVGIYNGENTADDRNGQGIPLFTHTAPISGTYQWKTTNTATIGTDSLTNGRANTTAMTGSAALRTAHPAATQCYNRGSQWYLPSIRELNVLSVAQRLNVSGIDTSAHWSSTQNSASTAWGQNLSSGSRNSYIYKTSSYSVRCLRR